MAKSKPAKPPAENTEATSVKEPQSNEIKTQSFVVAPAKKATERVFHLIARQDGRYDNRPYKAGDVLGVIQLPAETTYRPDYLAQCVRDGNVRFVQVEG